MELRVERVRLLGSIFEVFEPSYELVERIELRLGGSLGRQPERRGLERAPRLEGGLHEVVRLAAQPGDHLVQPVDGHDGDSSARPSLDGEDALPSQEVDALADDVAADLEPAREVALVREQVA